MKNFCGRHKRLLLTQKTLIKDKIVKLLSKRWWNYDYFFPILASHIKKKKTTSVTSLVIQWFKNLPTNAGDISSIPGPRRSHMSRSN